MPSASGFAHDHSIYLQHPAINGGQALRIETGMDGIRWSYELNVANFPTYGGEVVQILGVFIGPLTINGMVRNYTEMERIYKYLADYIQIASQGRGEGATAYNQKPMTLVYPHRDWHFEIMPTSAPAFRYSRETVVPEWRLEAHVVDHDGDVKHVKDLIVEKTVAEDGGDGTLDLVGEIGFVDENPWSDPFTDKKTFDKEGFSEANKALSKYYNDLIPSYLEGDFDSLTSGMGSKPAFGIPVPQVDTDDETKKKYAPTTATTSAAPRRR